MNQIIKHFLPLTILLASLGISDHSAAADTQLVYQDQQKLHDIANSASATNIEQDIKTLVSFGTRHTLSETESDTRGIGVASVSQDGFESPVVYPGAAGAFGE